MKANDLYASVTAVIIKQLEEGVPPWTRPWKDARIKGVGMIPSNLVTGRLYSGSNILLLWMSAQQRGYDNLQFCTYQQVAGIGAKVRKGEKSTHVIFTKHVTRKDEDSGDERQGTIVKSYPVFHVSQLDGVDPKYLAAQVPDDRKATHEQAISLVKGTGAKFSHGASKAAYYPSRDEIVVPTIGTFESEDAYWGVVLHELTHWSGAEKRLNRTFGKRFGDNAYASEELVAELGSAYLCAQLGFTPSFRSASYIDSWLKVLKGDNRAIFSAASYAGHAATYIWNLAFAEQRQAAE
ncbi:MULTISPECIES: ArdC family protein [Rhizobium]|uniref:ArdC family protein n=1 Tax=Rhizobium TaxID=379 RepID=UPI0013B81275|nr:zincin-like metallopeptidase domain-containing protein [Rhizobium ruizarguesonis]NEJ15526.1 DUF1738 domain-containing protein [Rhizobium ruizarguesonis]NEK29601.1 DUF1738 domain-containing protein [Rhizobium ruizarguesonis]